MGTAVALGCVLASGFSQCSPGELRPRENAAVAPPRNVEHITFTTIKKIPQNACACQTLVVCLSYEEIRETTKTKG